MNKLGSYQRAATLITLLFIAFSVYLVYDASSVWAAYKYGDPFYYLKRQSIYSLIAISALFFGKKVPLEKARKYAIPFLIFTNILLILVLIPGIGIMKGGSYSWLGFGSLSFQPSELYKLALILFYASYLSDHFRDTVRFRTIIPLLLWLAAGGVLIMLQPDFGTLVVIGGALVVMLFLSKMKIRYFVFGGAGIAALFVAMILMEPYRMQRIVSFIDPFADPLGAGFQIIQSMFALGPGGLIGEGINASVQKYYYLPEPQTDFIFAIAVEEFGYLGGLLIIGGYFLLFFYLYRIARLKNEQFHYLLSMGLLALIAVQVIINLGVVTALFPVTGITLPFLSYGGSSLIMLSFSVGIIIGGKKKCAS